MVDAQISGKLPSSVAVGQVFKLLKVTRALRVQVEVGCWFFFLLPVKVSLSLDCTRYIPKVRVGYVKRMKNNKARKNQSRVSTVFGCSTGELLTLQGWQVNFL